MTRNNQSCSKTFAEPKINPIPKTLMDQIGTEGSALRYTTRFLLQGQQVMFAKFSLTGERHVSQSRHVAMSRLERYSKAVNLGLNFRSHDVVQTLDIGATDF